MTDEDLKKIGALINLAIDPLKDNISSLKDDVNSLKSDVNLLKYDMSFVKAEIQEIREKQDSHTASLMEIESIMRGYADMYKQNKDYSLKHEQRISVIESHLGIIPPQELIVVD